MKIFSGNMRLMRFFSSLHATDEKRENVFINYLINSIAGYQIIMDAENIYYFSDDQHLMLKLLSFTKQKNSEISSRAY